MTHIRTNLLPHDPSPFGTSDRMMPDDYNEVLDYGTDADCRRALAAIVDLLDGQGIETLIADKESAQEDAEQLRYEVASAESQRDEEVEHGRKLHTVANDLAMALIDLMAHVKQNEPNCDLFKLCNVALDAFETVD